MPAATVILNISATEFCLHSVWKHPYFPSHERKKSFGRSPAKFEAHTRKTINNEFQKSVRKKTVAVKWSLFYANWYQPPWTDPKICPHSRTLRKFGKSHISPHGQTPLKFGKPHESLVTQKLLSVYCRIMPHHTLQLNPLPFAP